MVMRLPAVEDIAERVSASLVAPVTRRQWKMSGRVVEVYPVIIKAYLPNVALGELCVVEPDGMTAEVVSVQGQYAMLTPLGDPLGIRYGQSVRPLGVSPQLECGPHLVGAVVDGLGRIMSEGNVAYKSSRVDARPFDCAAPDPLSRNMIDTAYPVGVRAIDGMLTVGKGQRLGIFAAAGAGKSSLLGMICQNTRADVVVIALVGERGREVREFLEHALTPEARRRSVIVVATSDRPAFERAKAVSAATSIAEYFRDQGKDVVLMVDSLTRFARAAREIGLAAGERPASGGYPPSVFARLPGLLERAGCSDRGSITGFYTVLVEGDNMNEPIADEVRSILDGHIVLSRKLAAANHFPAIDVLASASRVMHNVVERRQLTLAGKARSLMSKYNEVELLLRVGEYRAGSDAQADEAVARRDVLERFLCQRMDESSAFKDTLDQLETAVKR
jgi:ATP synthase in type III secretion protein N